MKKIVPFNNVLTFSTDVCEITSISLEHNIKTEFDSISGVFCITGEYKITDGQLEKEKFNFELPFDIALGSEYNIDTLVVDIDDFRYELIDRNKLKVNIDLSINGDIIEKETSDKELSPETYEEPIIEVPIKNIEKDIPTLEDSREENDNLLSEMLETKDDNQEPNGDNDNNNNNNLFNSDTFEDKYVTYKVYRVVEGDTIEKIIEKYNTTKEELSKYNDITEIHPGDKLIISCNDK